MKTKYGWQFYANVTMPLWVPVIAALYSRIRYSDDPVGLTVGFWVLGGLFVAIFFTLPILKEFKQVVVADGEITYKYLFLSEKMRRLSEYDGFFKVDVYRSSSCLYLMKDHRREEVINIDFYKNKEELLAELEKHLKCLGEDNKNIFTHVFCKSMEY